ncbi:transglycosylase SLT domain-containing protein [Erythrobacter sp.]|uniref:lytic transglycosylase domain-containing protein n=1 Tax=Erythrobacter sp. TaxID=1042 RepID=UPI003C765415
MTTILSRTGMGFGTIAVAIAAHFIAAPAPAAAQSGTDGISGSMAAHYARDERRQTAVPPILDAEQRERYRDVFRAIEEERWDRVNLLLAMREGEVLHQIALAEYYTHANSPRVEAYELERWFQGGVHLPQAAQLSRLGLTRGLERTPSLPETQPLRRQPAASKRIRPATVADGSVPETERAEMLEAIRNDDPYSALTTLRQIDGQLSPQARAEWRQRVAWSFYIENDDRNALALAQTVAEGSGAWVAEGDWVAGLAAWRLGDCALAGEAFTRAAAASTNVELTTAAHYWAHRSAIRCRDPGLSQGHLRNAARFDETLYGMLASDQLAARLPETDAAQRFSREDWSTLRGRPNVTIAAALTEIGQLSLADEVLRHEARIGRASDYPALARFARELGLPATQLFMAHFTPHGVSGDASLRYPTARWQPSTGWRVDPALAFAHALQESNFRTEAVSPANARGLMQITPITVRQHAPRLDMNASYVDLDDPEVNLAFGQRNLEMLRDHGATRGQLPKIMAAYNAGLTPVIRWNDEIRDLDDPLLWMESIPYWETRGYVAIVMRNYWMYERAAGIPSPSRRALAEGRWPDFPEARRID